MKKGKYHFIGLGGIGMSALARILLQKGCEVKGSDVAQTPLLQELEKEGAIVQVGHRAKAIEAGATVVYSGAVKEENVEYAEAKKLQLPLLHRSDLLDQLMKGKRPLLVTGTHGKTTTTALLTSVLLAAELHPSFVIGAILRSLETNGQAGKGVYFVAEADESDGSFLKTAPFGAIVTNLENDHLDYWKEEKQLDAAFGRFIALVQKPNHFFWCADDPRLSALCSVGHSYGFSENAHLRITAYRPIERGISFDLEWRGKKYSDVQLPLFGRHNALNGAAVFGLSLSLNIPEETIRRALKQFRGTARRLERKGEAYRLELYDDYAHHPTEITATLAALREQIGERRLIAVFQPHRYTRVRDLFREFATCFQDADAVILTDIYSAGEAPIEGITAETFCSYLREKLGAKLHFFPRSQLEKGAAKLFEPLDVVVLLGAGDITRAGVPLLNHFAQRDPKLTVAVLCGGTSAEHTVSLMSARNIAASLDPSLYQVKLFKVARTGEWLYGPNAIEAEHFSPQAKLTPEVLRELLQCDVAIPVFHGPQGEDGMIQGFLDTLFLPYVGCDYRGAALCMHKGWTKEIALLNQVPTPPFVSLDIAEHRKNSSLLLSRIAQTLAYPVWIKAVHLGSSIGVSRAATPEDVPRAIETAFAVDDSLIAEQEIEGREIEFAVLGNEVIRIAPPCEILNGGAFYDYERKYGPQAVGVKIPAPLTELEQKIGFELAERMYRAAGCKGLARVDFFLDKNGHYWLNEINPFPGFTAMSGYPKMWEAQGVSPSKLFDELIALAFHRSRSLVQLRGC